MSENNNNSFAAKYKKQDTAPAQNESRQGMSMSEKFASQKPITTANNLNKGPMDNIKSSQSDLVYLVKGIDNSKNAWYYVLVERLKLSMFLKALNDDIIHLENYGKILYSAYGDDPSQEITDRLKEEYGIN